MRDESDNEEGERTGALARLLPTAVVLGAVAGFVALAWYAYHSGAQSLKGENLLVVEADKGPLKEKPLDPGGMKFPNQDKTVFETFTSTTQAPPKVERVLPKPEEPMSKNLDTSETTTWVNEKYQQNAAADMAKPASSQPEQMIGAEDKAPEPEKEPVKTAGETSAAAETFVPAAPVQEKAKPLEVQEVATQPVASQVKPVQQSAKSAVKNAVISGKGNSKVQLGAYRSEKEASDDWLKIQHKFAALSGKQPLIVKADLPKGTFYRLRVNGFANSSEAKAFCSVLTSKGQGCILPTE